MQVYESYTPVMHYYLIYLCPRVLLLSIHAVKIPTVFYQHALTPRLVTHVLIIKWTNTVWSYNRAKLTLHFLLYFLLPSASSGVVPGEEDDNENMVKH
jgi:hypothetical protein